MVTAPILTDAGRALLMRALAGDGLVFTKFKIGSGDPPADATALVDLVAPEYVFGITEIDKTTRGYVTITGSFDNSIVQAPMRWTELGLYAQLDEQGAEEVLYAYVNDGDQAGSLTPTGAVVAEQRVNLMIIVGNAENVTAIMAESAVFATKAELQEHASNTSNPHNVTKEQIGLGLVENLTFDNQVVNFSAAQSLSDILTGERMSTLMGKIKTAITSLISHIGNTSNPHGVTPAQIGAAKTSHTHTAMAISEIGDRHWLTTAEKTKLAGIADSVVIVRLVCPQDVPVGIFFVANDDKDKLIDAIENGKTPVLLYDRSLLDEASSGLRSSMAPVYYSRSVYGKTSGKILMAYFFEPVVTNSGYQKMRTWFVDFDTGDSWSVTYRE